MTGGNPMGPQLPGTLQQGAKFQLLIAHDTRIGRPARLVLFGKILNDVLLKIC